MFPHCDRLLEHFHHRCLPLLQAPATATLLLAALLSSSRALLIIFLPCVHTRDVAGLGIGRREERVVSSWGGVVWEFSVEPMNRLEMWKTGS